MNVSVDLLNKYNVQVPRYTSYPTVPVWKENISVSQWKETFSKQFSIVNAETGISLYLHLPFCEKLCTYCGCNKKITTNHDVEEEYMKAVLKEWKQYTALMNQKPVIAELHLGGGTPTFFSPANLHKLLQSVFDEAIIPKHHEFSFEGHPNNTSREHLQTLFNLGFRRVSYGVQDNDPKVQFIINRIQPFENLVNAVNMAREIGYSSVNFDLIYGLPLQTLEGMQKTIEQCITLLPDRIAFYSYAHVPWTSRGQRLFDEKDLPTPDLKMKLYCLGKDLLMHSGYYDIGMDHFALPADDLYIAWENGTLHRNFMGYTTQNTGMLLGLGVSSISDLGIAFAQNHKTIHDYYQCIENNELPVTKGFFLSDEDVTFRKYILRVSCQGNVRFALKDLPLLEQFTFPELESLQADGLLNYTTEKMEVTPLGRHFIRNICKSFDLHLLRNIRPADKNMFSRAI